MNLLNLDNDGIYIKQSFIPIDIVNKIDKELSFLFNISSIDGSLGYMDLLKSNEIGLSTVQLSKAIILDELFPPLKTKEDYVAWLKITKNNIYAHNFPHNLVIWNKTKDSLSSDFFQKISDGIKVFRKYENFNLIKSLYYLFILSINSIKRKI